MCDLRGVSSRTSGADRSHTPLPRCASGSTPSPSRSRSDTRSSAVPVAYRTSPVGPVSVVTVSTSTSYVRSPWAAPGIPAVPVFSQCRARADTPPPWPAGVDWFDRRGTDPPRSKPPSEPRVPETPRVNALLREVEEPELVLKPVTRTRSTVTFLVVSITRGRNTCVDSVTWGCFAVPVTVPPAPAASRTGSMVMFPPCSSSVSRTAAASDELPEPTPSPASSGASCCTAFRRSCWLLSAYATSLPVGRSGFAVDSGPVSLGSTVPTS